MPTIDFVGCRRDSQIRKQTRFRKCAPQSSQRLATVWGPNCGAKKNCSCRSRVLLVAQKQLKTNVLTVFGPPGTGALRASDATSFSAAAPENGPCLAFWYSRCRIAQPLFREKKGGSRKPTMTYFGPSRNDVFCTCVRTGRPKRSPESS